MELNVDGLQQQLSERIAELDKQRLADAERFAKETAAQNLKIELERADRLAQDNKKRAELAAKKSAEELVERVRKQEDLRIRIERQRDLDVANEKRHLELEKAKLLADEAIRQAFIQEQHDKALQYSKIIRLEPEVYEGINVEHPVAPLNVEHPGDAVVGTNGNTPENALMSQHMRLILRQANRMGE